MRRAWILASTVLLAGLGGTIYFARQLAMFDQIGPGPGFFPFWLGIIGAALAGLLLIQTVIGPAGGSVEILPPTLADAGRPLAVIVGLAAVAGLVEILGYRIAAGLFVVGLLIALGVRRWLLIALLGAIGSAAIFHIFYFWLKVPLPYGTFGI